ncbi:protein C3orf33 homolog [Watersipora subatra]|uniref:protein C3orf33 homolog n=1 Tax=Watersipora subatra TaxID=2589382 RepID=UPI00355BFFFF
MSSGDDKEKLRKGASLGLTSFSNSIDNHLQLVQRSIYGLGVLTLLGLAKRYKLWTKFCSRSDIPVEFYRRNVKLRGKVVDIGKTGSLLVDHKPAIRIPSVLSTKTRDDCLLDVHMAGVNITPSGLDWLNSNLLSNTVWFRLLESPENGKEIPAIISYRTKFGLWRKNINTYLVYYGMAKLRSSSDTDPTSQIYNRLLEQLIKAEKRAEQKGVGDWEKVTWRQWLREKLIRRKF